MKSGIPGSRILDSAEPVLSEVAGLHPGYTPVIPHFHSDGLLAHTLSEARDLVRHNY